MSETEPGMFGTTSTDVDNAPEQVDENVQDITTDEPKDPNDDGQDNLEKIRGILFGEQSREYSHRFNELESRLEIDSKRLRDDMLARVEALESHIKEQVQRLDATDDKAQQSRQLLEQGLQQNLDALKQEMLQKIMQLDDRFNHELKQLDYKYQKLNLQMRQQHELFSKLLAQEVKQLQQNKVDRSELAGFLSDTALRLSRNGDG